MHTIKIAVLCNLSPILHPQGVSGDGPADPNPPDESGQVQSQNGLGTGDGGRGIQPSHIREALRRLSVPSGPLLPLAVSANYGSTQ